MTIETSKLDKDKSTLLGLLSKTHREELNEILAIGEKYKKEGEEMRNKFWNEYGRYEFVNLEINYRDSESRFIEGLELEEKRVINSLNGIERKKFFDEYLKDRILYSGDIEREYKENCIGYRENVDPGKEGLKKRLIEQESKLEPGMEIEFLFNELGSGLVKIIAEEWKDKLQPGMKIYLSNNNIGDEGIEVLAKERRNCLQPGMEIKFDYNNIGDKGVEALAREWKGKLQPGMTIDLDHNKIGDGGLEILANERKKCLQPGIGINLQHNNIGNNGVEILAKEWKDGVQPGMYINLKGNNISDEGAEILAEEWKDKLQPGMQIFLGNNIGDEGVSILAREWKDKLQPGMFINLTDNKIGDEGVDEIMKLNLKEGVIIGLESKNISPDKKKELEQWEKSYKDMGIHCAIILV